MKWPPLDPGTRVVTLVPKVKDWTEEAEADRRWGVPGTIIRHHDSHGLCYAVRHDDGTVGYYDPSEFRVDDNPLTPRDRRLNEFAARLDAAVRLIPAEAISVIVPADSDPAAYEPAQLRRDSVNRLRSSLVAALGILGELETEK